MKYKNRLETGLLIMALSLIIGSCGNSSNRDNDMGSDSGINTDSINKVITAQAMKEEKVADAFITDANVLYLAVQDDGTDRNGYAEYFCGILQEHPSKVKWIKVVASGTAKSPKADNAYGVLLGESRCEWIK